MLKPARKATRLASAVVDLAYDEYAASLEELGIDGAKVAVYLPHSYNFSGNLFIVPANQVTPIDASASDVMKFIVSGGVTKLKKTTKTTSL